MNKICQLLLLGIALLASEILPGDLKGKIKYDEDGLNNVLVSLELREPKTFPPPKEPAEMDQVNLNFKPHVLPVLLGTKVIFPNSDKLRHSVFSMSKVKKFDLGTYAPGAEKSIVCDQPGVIPILCYIHHDMSAYIVVLKTPYFDLTDGRGDFIINNIPAGNYTLTFWHEDEQIDSEDIQIPKQGVITKNITVED